MELTSRPWSNTGGLCRQARLDRYGHSKVFPVYCLAGQRPCIMHIDSS